MPIHTIVATVRPRCAGVALLSAALLLSGCHSGARRAGRNPPPSQRAANSGPASRAALTLDGRFEDWPRNVATVADADWIYFRVTVQGLDAPLQGAPET